MYTPPANELNFTNLHRLQPPLPKFALLSQCEAEVTVTTSVLGIRVTKKGQYYFSTKKPFDRLPDKKPTVISLILFDWLQIDRSILTKPNFSGANEGGEKAYELLIHAMKETGKVAIARVMIRTKETLAALRIWQDTVVMETMFYHDEVRRPESLPPSRPARIHENEIKMAVNLVQNLSTHFEPEKYTNVYRQALREMIEAKIAGEQIAVPAAPETGKVIDLMDALKASLAAVEQRNAAAAEAGGGGQPRSTKTRQTRRKKAVT